MIKIKLLFFCVGFLAFLCIEDTSGAPLEALNTQQLRKIMETVPEPERNTFIKTNIDLGYKIEQLHDKASSAENGELAVQIFDYFVDNQEAIRKRKEIFNSINLMETICYPEPIGCIDPDDPGIRPGVF